MHQLERTHPKLYEKLPRFYGKLYWERSGYFADVKSSQAKRRLATSARHLFDLVDRFRGHKEISRMKSYRLMVRLLEEQCHTEPRDPLRPSWLARVQRRFRPTPSFSLRSSA